jgi:TolB protein
MKPLLIATLCLTSLLGARAQQEIEIVREFVPGNTRPIYVSMTGISGEAAQVLQFDLYVQGFAFTNAEGAQYLIDGGSTGNLQGRVTDKFSKRVLVAKAYTGGTTRRQAHAFADDFVKSLERVGIAQTKIAFKVDTGSNSELYISDFDGFNPTGITKDGSIVAAPSWVPGRLALFYTSYKLNHPDIFFHDLSSGSRKIFARYGGSNMSPSVSPDGRRVAMVLSKDGWTDLYVGDVDGGEVKRLTRSREDESAPCWSHDGKWICFAAKIKERRSLCKIPVGGGEIQRISTVGVLNPTEPDWSPDGKWIVFTSMMGGFEVCVVPAEGGQATQLVAGEDATWGPNSRTVVFARRQGGRRVLSLLDVPTKQVKDVARVPGSNSQPAWAR